MKISILMPCYNSKNFLKRSIESVLNQEYKNLELICVDDCSSDDTYELLKAYERLDERIKTYKMQKNQGTSAALNYALDRCSGDFIFLLGHDDELETKCLFSCVDRYNELGGGIDIIIPDAFFIKDGLKIASICGIRNKENSKERILKAWEAFELSLFWDIAGFALFRACLLKKIRFLESAMNGDEYAVRACFLEANKIAFAREGAYLYHQVSTSLTKKLSPRKFNIHRVFYELEKLAIEKKLPKKLIKKINKERYNQLYNLSKEFEEKKHLLKEEEKRLIRSYLDENESLLSFYKSSFFDSIFRKQKDKFGKFVLFFSFFKIYYKR